MLLARAMARGREMATRLAVGAGRGQLIVQLLAETLLLFTLAAAAISLAARLVDGARFLDRSCPTLPLPVALDLAVDAAGAGLRADPGARHRGRRSASRRRSAPRGSTSSPALHGQHSTPDRRRVHLRHVLVGAQVAMSLVLLVTTGLFLRALQSAANADTGYERRARAGLHAGHEPGRASRPGAVALADRIFIADRRH